MLEKSTEAKPGPQDIYTASHEKVCHYLARVVRNAESAGPTHEVFVKAVVANTVWGMLRSEDFKRSVQEMLSTGEDELAIGDKDVWGGRKRPLPDQQLICRKINPCIRGFIDSLPALEIRCLARSSLGQGPGISGDLSHGEAETEGL
jgi:hypothetical protein